MFFIEFSIFSFVMCNCFYCIYRIANVVCICQTMVVEFNTVLYGEYNEK